ncbi:hypothetical protein KA005_18080 [bacterium]|nr:hypothetical protein [bacterium]
MKKHTKSLIALLGFILVAIVLAMVMEQESGPILGMAIAVYTRACLKNVSGNSKVFLAEAANLSTITITASEISAITMATGLTFHEVQANIDGVVRTEEGAGSRNNISYTHQVQMFFNRPSTELNILRDSLTAASSCGILAIVQDANGECWLTGYNATDDTDRAMYVQQDSINSGQEAGEEDSQVDDIILETVSGYIDLPFDDTLKGTIVAGTATFITWI